MEKPDWGRYTQKGDIIYAHVYETPLGALPLYGIGPDKLESVTYLADGSEVNRGEAWNTVLYPDVAFVPSEMIRYLPIHCQMKRYGFKNTFATGVKEL